MWWRSLLVTSSSKFGLLNIRWHSKTRKHLLLYLQGNRSGLRKPKKIIINTNHSYHQHSSPCASLNWSKNKTRFKFNQPLAFFHVSFYNWKMVVKTQSWVDQWNSITSCVLFLKHPWIIFHYILIFFLTFGLDTYKHA